MARSSPTTSQTASSARSDRALAPSRLPSTRESRPGLIALAVILIVGGALASAYLAIVAGHRADFVRVDNVLAQGDRIQAGDLEKVSLPEGYDDGVPWSQRSSVVGKATTVRLLKGTILTPDMYSASGGISPDDAQLSIEVDPMTAAGMHPGARLLIYAEDEDGGQHDIYGQLMAVGHADSGGLTGTTDHQVPIRVLVSADCAGFVSQGILNNKISVSVTGGSGAPSCKGG